MALELMIGVVGKPSAGKSTFFNAVCENGKAKTGNFPFTTIDPNEGVSVYRTECACKSRGKTAVCAPRYGWCHDGTRGVQIKLLDVAGLIPGASEGAGLGNKFLDDLRHAHTLIHVIDVSGKTNEKGEVTEGYDPSNDVDWLTGELHAWIFNNLWKRWASVVRRHVATKSSATETLQAQLSGYGANHDTIVELVTALGVKEPNDLHTWGEDEVHNLVKTFIDVRFPTILLLNKADSGGDCDRNIEKLCRKYDPEKCIVASSLAECFLKKQRADNVIRYPEGSSMFLTRDDLPEGEKESLVEATPKVSKRLEKLLDMVMFRFGGTGVWKAVQAAAELKKCVVAYPVKSLTSFSTSDNSSAKAVFGNAIMLKEGSTVRQLAHAVHPDVGANLLYAESEDGRRMGDGDIVAHGAVIKFTTGASEASAGAGSGSGSGSGAGAGSGGAASGGGSSTAGQGKRAKGGATEKCVVKR